MVYKEGTKVEFKENSDYDGTAEVIRDGVMVLVEKDKEKFKVPKNEVKRANE